MKKLKKLLAGVLAAMLVLAVQVPVPVSAWSWYAPSAPKVTYCGYSSNGKLRVQWKTQSDADGYLIKYYDLVTGAVKKVYVNENGTDRASELYHIINRDGNKVNRVLVSAYNYDYYGNISFSTATQKYVCSSRSISSSNKSGSSMTINWRKLYGASGYRLYRSKSRDSGYSLYKTLSGGTTSCRLTGLSGYTYFQLIPYRNVNGGKWNLPISAFYTQKYY